MTHSQMGQFLLALGGFLGCSYLLAGLLVRLRIPGILGALLAAMLLHYTPLGAVLLSPELNGALSLLANLGVLVLLFFIGLQINLQELLGVGRDILWLTSSTVMLTFLFIATLMLALGHGWLLAIVVAMTRLPTAEAVVVPILDEFRLIRTRVGELIIGISILDDLIEVFLVAVVSLWIREQSADRAALHITSSTAIALSASALTWFSALAWLSYTWVVPYLSRWIPPRNPNKLILFSMGMLLCFSGLSEWAGLGMVLGAIGAGIIIRPTFNRLGIVGEQAMHAIQSVTYGFLAQMFVFWVGLNVDLQGIWQAPMLTVLLIVISFTAKLSGVLLMVPLRRLSFREAWTVGISINAGLTTEIIVAQLLLNARLIDVHLFTAVVAASSVTTVSIPLLLGWILHYWQEHLAVPQAETLLENGPHVPSSATNPALR